MKGRRVLPNENGWFNARLEPGDYVKLDPQRTGEGEPLPTDWPYRKYYPYWIACSPNGHQCSLARHSVIEHEDGTITVAPSILISRGGPDSAGSRPYEQLWHGFLERGFWREV